MIEPVNAAAFETKKAAILSLAANTMNSQARNMLLADYLLMTGQNRLPVPFGDSKAIFSRMADGAVRLMPLSTLFRIMAVNLNASKSRETDAAVALHLTDLREDAPAHHTLYVRRGVFEVDPPSSGKTRFTITTDSLTWKRLVLGKLSPESAVEKGQTVVSEATPDRFYSFMDLFVTPSRPVPSVRRR